MRKIKARMEEDQKVESDSENDLDGAQNLLKDDD